MQLFPRSRTPRARIVVGALAATATLASTALIPGAGAQTPAATTTEAAGSWLADQLVDGTHMEVTFGTDSFNDYGLTIDVVFALAESGVAESFAADATAFLGESINTSSYIGDGTDESYAGATAKLALLALVRGEDPADWGEDGIDLIARLQGLENADGRFADLGAFGDFSNSIGQSLAIITLARQAGVDPSTQSVQLLLASQCADGGFDLALEPAADACVSGVDTTAIALQALIALVPETDAVADAIAYLLAAQQADGGFATTASGAPNANSTGIAAQTLALPAVDEAAAADAAVAFLVSLQQDCTADLADQGGVAFDQTGFDAGTAPRATAQALLGMGGIGFLTLRADDQADTQPRFAPCPVVVDPAAPVDPGTPVTPVDPGTPVTPTATPVVTPAPAATPVRANPTFTG